MGVLRLLVQGVGAVVRGVASLVAEWRDAMDDTPRLHQVRQGLAALVAERQAEIRAARVAREAAGD
jgi:hypothetical protein